MQCVTLTILWLLSVLSFVIVENSVVQFIVMEASIRIANL